MEKTFTLKTVQKVIGLEEIASTQELANSLSATEAEGTLILACRQTSALDSFGKPLYAGEGGVYFSLILRPRVKITQEKLIWALANAVSDVITEVLQIKTKLSKTGDILVYEKKSRKWKKCACICAEESSHDTWLLGAGIYLNNHLPVATGMTCVSLKSILGSSTSKELFLEEVLSYFWKEYAFL